MRSSPSLLYSFKKRGGGGETRMPMLFHLKEVILVTFGLSCIPINNICLSSLIRDQWRCIIVAQIESK